MDVPVWVPVLALAVGILGVLRSAFIVAGRGHGRFRGDPWISLVAGFGLVLLGQYLLGRSLG